MTIEGLFAEVSRGFAHRFDPLTVCSYDVDVSDIVDLRTEVGRDEAGVSLDDMACPWALDIAEGRAPVSWSIAAKFFMAGAAGLLVPSFAHGARPDRNHNLVLWKWGHGLPHRVVVHDPAGRLPRDRRSWDKDPDR